VRFKVIVNPLAGRGFGARSMPQIQSLLSMRGLDFDMVVTACAGEAIELARQAVLDGYDTVVATGGDGTFQEVINGMLAASNGEVIGNLGVLPVGSGNDFAWSVGVPFDLEGACARLAEQQTKVIDIGRITVDGVTRYFDNTVGIGFEGVVTVEARRFKRLRGIALYLPAVLRSVFVSMDAACSVIEYEDKGELRRLEGDFLMVDVCNGERAGGSFFVAPHAETDDGLLDLCFVEDIPRLRMLGLIPHFLKGTHVQQPDVAVAQSKRVVVTSPDSLIAHADGELLCTDAHCIECEIVPQRIRVVC
jgi:diacylglycerol kinase (ATP)